LRAHGGGPQAPLDGYFRLYPDFLHAEDRGAGLLDLIQKRFQILFPFRFQLEEPGMEFRPGLQLLRVEIDPNAFTRLLFVKCHGKAPQVEDLQPAVADGAGGEELYGVGEADRGLTDGVEEFTLREIFQGRLDDEAADDQPRGQIAVKRFYEMDIFII